MACANDIELPASQYLVIVAIDNCRHIRVDLVSAGDGTSKDSTSETGYTPGGIKGSGIIPLCLENGTWVTKRSVICGHGIYLL